LCSDRGDCSGSGEVDERLLPRLLSEAGGLLEYDCSSTIDELLSSRLLPEVAGVVEYDCSWDITDLLISSKLGAGISFSGPVMLRRYGACITGFNFSSKAKGLKQGMGGESSRESPNLENDEVKYDGGVIRRGKGEDYVSLRPRLAM
jgi:hypothetical protein